MPLSVSETEFLDRLNESLVPTKLRLLFQNGFIGSASATSVKVRWARRWVSNDLAPAFEGRVTPDHKFVRGTFRQRPWVLAFLILSVALGFAGIVIGLVVGAGTSLDPRWVAASVVALVVFAAFLPRLGWAMASSDVERITEALRAAARGQSPRVESQ